ncbi:MAG TPA: CHAT domain-containing tetratricopeptide repeat protein, partial [Vineibacter sp.]|nr:CHAT domain-containing tetratricopeptide repeat protein [Vineibacter sp.]
LAGEACVYRPVTPEPSLRARLTVDITCGAATEPVARVSQLDGAGDPAALAGWASIGPWRTLLDGRAYCERASTTTLAGQPAELLACARRAGSVPYVAIATTRGGATFLADGVSTAATAIEATIAALSGDVATGRGIGINAALGGRFLTTYGVADAARFQVLMRVGARHNLEEEYGEAERTYREALALHQKLFGRDNPEQADPLAHLAMNISNQGRFEEATTLFRRAETLSARTRDPLIHARLQQYQAQHLANQGLREQARAGLDRAEALYDIAAPTLKPILDQAVARGPAPAPAHAFGVRGQRFVDPRRDDGGQVGSSAAITPSMEWAAQGVAEIYRTRALLALGENQPERAQQFASKGVALLQAVGTDPGGARWRVVRVAGLGAAADKKLPQASADLGSSARGINDSLPQSQPAGKTFFESGAIHGQRGNRTAAVSEFRRGAQILRSRRTTVAGDLVVPYLDALAGGTRIVTGTPASEMFDAAQLIGSSVTATFVAQAAVRLGSSQPAIRTLQEQELKLLELYQRRDIATNAGADAATVQAIDTQVAVVVQARDAAERDVRATAPSYFQLVQGQPTAAELLAVLQPGEAFLQFVLAEPGGYGLLVHGGQVVAWRIDLGAAEAARIVQALRRSFQPDARGELPAYDVALAHDLYKRLLAPVAGRLVGAKALVVAADGALQSLPFAVLVTAPPPVIAGAADYKTVAWLAKTTTLSYVPTPQSFVLLRRVAAQSKAPRRYVGFGGYRPLSPGVAAQALQQARDGAAATGAACAADTRDLAALPPLALAESEVALTADKLGVGRAAVHTGAAFGRAAVLRGGLDQYRIVHFAGHALLPAELRCLQQPVLLTAAGTGGDALLTAADVAGLRLDADLVVLSGCNTAGADGRSAGEAFSGLARAFFTAGTRGVMASHWTVADEATTLMMINLLSDVARGTPPATALRQAQLDMIANAGVGSDPIRWAHPFYWAPFAYAGAQSVPEAVPHPGG